MKLSYCIFFTLLLSAAVSYAQPRYSPAIRAERETNWMHDSLHLPQEKLTKVNTISLAYNQRMDSVSETHNKNKEKIKQKLMKKKDADIKALLSKEQYQRYYKREQLIRQRENIKYDEGHQPY